MRVPAFLLLGVLLSVPARTEDALPPRNPLTAKSISEFQSGQKAAACADATAALAQDPSDKDAMGISRLTCGQKAIDRMDFKKKEEKPGTQKKDDLKPKPFSGKANAPQDQQAQPQPSAGQPGGGLESGALPAENDLGSVISGGPSAPGVQDQPTTYDKLTEAQSLLSAGRPAQAAEAARMAVQLQPRNRRAFDAWAEAVRQLRSYDQVLAIADLGLKSFPNDPDLLKNKIFALNKKKDFAAAAALADQALSLYATDPALLALKAYALGRGGDRAGMLKALETAFALDPSFEPLLIDARASKDGEPFLMPGDSKAEPRRGIAAKRESASWFGLFVLGGLIGLLLLLAVLLATGVFKRGSDPEAP